MSEDAEIVEETVEEVVVDVRPIAGIGTLVFGKWDPVMPYAPFHAPETHF